MRKNKTKQRICSKQQNRQRTWRKRQRSAEKVREKKRALEADAAKSKKIAEMFSAGPQQPVAGPSSTSDAEAVQPPSQEERVGFQCEPAGPVRERSSLLLLLLKARRRRRD